MGITLKDIDNDLKKGHRVLLGEYIIDSKIFEKFLSIAEKTIAGAKEGKKLTPDGKLYLSIALVQIAKKEYNERKFWANLQNKINIKINTNLQQQIGTIFLETIRKYNLFEIKNDTNRNIYAQNILAHSYVADEYLDGYFEFLYSFYEKNMLCDFDEENIKDDITNLVNFIRQNGNTDDISEGNATNGIVKTYKLLKSTKSVISQGKSNLVYKILYNHLKYLDNIFYDKYKEIDDYFINKLKEWLENKREEHYETRKKYTLNNEIFRNKPAILCLKNSYPYICIPEQKLQNDVNDCQVDIYVNGKLYQSNELDIYATYGAKKTDLKLISIEEKLIFEEIKVIIETGTKQKSIIFNQKDYRFFKNVKNNDFDCYNIDESEGEFSLVVKKDAEISLTYEPTYKNSVWNEYPIVFDTNTILIINNDLISLNHKLDENGYEITFKKPLNYYLESSEQNDDESKTITTTFQHPKIFLRQSRDFFEKNPLLYVNNKPIKLKDCKNIKIFNSENEKIDIIFKIDDIIDNKDEGEYTIKLEIPGKSSIFKNKKYILIPKDSLSFTFDKNMYFYEKEAKITKNGSYYITGRNCKKIERNKYLYQITNNENIIKFDIEIAEKEYVVSLPLNIFQYKFNNEKLKYLYTKENRYIWFKNIEKYNYLYVCLPNAFNIELYLDNDSHYPIPGIQDEKNKNIFIFDISTFIAKFKTNKQYMDELYIRFSINGKTYIEKIGRIIQQPIFKKFDFNYDYKDNMAYIETDIEGCPNNYECSVLLFDVGDSDKKNGIEIPLKNGKNYIKEINQRNNNAYYNLHIYLIKKSSSSKNLFARNDDTTERKIIEKRNNISPIHVAKITPQSIIRVKEVDYKGTKLRLNYLHEISISYEDNHNKGRFIGCLYINDAKKKRNRYKVYVKAIPNYEDCIFIYTDNDNLLYDETHKILWDQIPRNANKTNFISLKEECTKFVSEIKEREGH